MNAFKKKSFVFLFSDFEDQFSENTLRITAKKHALLALRIYDDKENQIPDMGYALFKNAETGEPIWANTSNSRWRYDYAEKQKLKYKNLQEKMEKASAGYLSLSTGSSYAQSLVRYFQHKR
jgi:uncharacterized protein (DUF58 family)